MDCFAKCCGQKVEEPNEIYPNITKGNLNIDNQANAEAYQKLCSSLQKVIKDLKNIEDKEVDDDEKMQEVFKKIATDYDQQITDINKMKQDINKIAGDARKDKVLKEIVLDLKDIGDGDAFSTVVETVISNLETAIKQLKTSKEKETQALSSLKESNNILEELRADAEKKEGQADIFVQSNLVDYMAPKNLNDEQKNAGHYSRHNILGYETQIYFLSKEGTLLQGDQLTKNYAQKDFNSSQFYCLGEDGKYEKLNNLANIDSLDTGNIILAHQMKK